MSDLISRQAAQAIKVLPKCYREYKTGNLDDAYDEGWEDAMQSLNALPTIDPVKHGKWLKYPGDIVSDDGLWGETLYACSECGHIRHVATEFCSKCGAKMEQDGEIQVRWKSDLISRQAALNELPHANWGKEWD